MVRLETQIEKFSGLVRLGHWVAAEDVVLQNTGKCPVHAGIGGITPPSLPEVGLNGVELPPTDHHLVAIGRVNSNRRLVRSIADNVVAARIDVGLITGKYAELRDHARRSLHFTERRRRVVIFFERLIKRRLAYGCQRLA